jgi:hypothetical protein
MKAAFLAAAVLAIAGVAFYFSTTVHAAKASGPGSAELKPTAHKTLTSKSLSLPLFFEPNRGQTAPQVKFLARGAGYGLFLTADEAVLQLHSSAVSSQPSALSSQPVSSSVIRMRLDGANSSARVSGASPLPGKSSYFIGNDPSKWHRDIPQFARVQYEAVYPGVNLVYYGDQGQLEYDFRVAPAADPNQIALSFNGASARIVSGDLLLATDRGDVRFQAPRIYQQDGKIQTPIAGSFRQLADNKIGFTIGDYDHARELVIDPVLSYSTYLGGSKTEAQVKIAVDAAQLIYVAGATDSPDFPVTDTSSILNPAPGAQNIFISKINPTLAGTAQLVYSVYLGGSGTDSLSGIAVDAAFSIYVAGSTTSSDFPTTPNAFQQKPQTGSHGFLTRISLGLNATYAPAYSTYLAGNGVDHVTGLAIDTSQQNAYVTGDTTSTNPASDGFPANANAFQPCPFGPVQSNGTCPVASGPPQFFASKINTGGSGSLSMLYSTYFGGGNPAAATAIGGGIAVDPSPNSAPNMYITGTTNMLPTVGGNGEAKFPLFNAQQSCLNEASNHGTCTGANGTTNTDAFVAKINPNQAGSNPVYSTYVGGGGVDVARAIAVDTSGMAYITGSTNSTDWVCTNSCPSSFQGAYGGGATDAFIVKIGNLTGSIFPLTYFTYLGGNGDDIGNDIKVDSSQGAHVVGSTTSTNFPTTVNTLQSVYGLGGDAFVASIGTTLSGVGNGDLSTYLGGSQLDQGTGIDLDIFGATYVAGNTLSPNFPTKNPYQLSLNGGSQDAFVTEIGAASTLALSNRSTSPTPNPVAAGTQVAFTFDILNQGPDNASNVTFLAVVPIGGAVASSATAKVTSGSGSCGTLNGNTIQCLIPTLTACIEPLCTSPLASVEVDVTPSITAHNPTISVSGSVSANGGGTQGTSSQTAKVVDFSITASTSTPVINAGDTATFQVVFAPTTNLGYNATITPSQTTTPGMVTATTPTFNPTTITLSGTASATTTLSIATVARPVPVASLFRRGSFYAAWLPIGGLSLVGLGLGAGRKRRRWLAGAVLCLIAGAILLQSGCGSSSSSPSTGGGTQPGTYIVTISGSAGTGASHSTQVQVQVN